MSENIDSIHGQGVDIEQREIYLHGHHGPFEDDPGVEYRMAHLLLKLADRIGEESTDSGIKIPLFLSRQDIADLVGTTVETAIRVMSRWRKMDIVTNDKRGIIIRDRETLEDLAAGITMHI